MKTFHTIDVISEIIQKNPQIKEINLAVYKYIPQTLTDKGRLKIHKIKCDKSIDIKNKILSAKIPEGWRLGLTSKVKMKDNSYKHIPQIDFECFISNKNLNEIKRKLSKIVKIFPGYIINSGASYHYVGLKLLGEKQWQKFIGLCLLCKDPKKKSIVDSRWCGHQLVSDYSNLRILACDSRPEPRVIAFIKK
ncbi:hypothetical protein KKA23_02720 [Patescibacteria group bacterium]|nr:hypothetical protein [Patescibacteria group bacterium]